MTDMPCKIRRAIISVSDKSGLIELANRLSALGVELISTGGTAKALSAAGIDVTDVASLTGFPEMMDGRVRTLHPNIHGGLLFRRDNQTHIDEANQYNIQPIDLIYNNLYPFETIIKNQSDFDQCIENIDIGGPAMLRASAKNADFITVCTDREDLEAALEEMEANAGCTHLTLRRQLAAKTFARTAAYDAAISNWYLSQLEQKTLPKWYAFGGVLRETLRYGENPHQSAAIYDIPGKAQGLAQAGQIQGKPLSYNNLNDADAAFELLREFDTNIPTSVIIKHANPCGVAHGASLAQAYQNAFDCDRVSAFGGVIALNQTLDAATAQQITSIFTEIVIAPDADDDALAIFAKKKNLRLLLCGTDALNKHHNIHAKSIKFAAGGLLVQSADQDIIGLSDLKQVTQRAPSDAELKDLLFAWRVAKHVKSNAIVFAKDGATAGVGAGQMSRVDSARIAAQKAKEAAQNGGWDQPKTQDCVAASDAFFPFADGLEQIIAAGAKAVIQPGGSIRDDEVIAAADKAGIAMVFTRMRHFRH